MGKAQWKCSLVVIIMLDSILHIPVLSVTAAWHVSDVEESLAATVSVAVAVCIFVLVTVAVAAAVTSAVAATVCDNVFAKETIGAAVAAAASALALTGRDKMKNRI